MLCSEPRCDAGGVSSAAAAGGFFHTVDDEADDLSFPLVTASKPREPLTEVEEQLQFSL